MHVGKKQAILVFTMVFSSCGEGTQEITDNKDDSASDELMVLDKTFEDNNQPITIKGVDLKLDSLTTSNFLKRLRAIDSEGKYAWVGFSKNGLGNAPTDSVYLKTGNSTTDLPEGIFIDGYSLVQGDDEKIAILGFFNWEQESNQKRELAHCDKEHEHCSDASTKGNKANSPKGDKINPPQY